MNGVRLSPETARSFLDRLGQHIERNVNIIDQDGIIIASRDPSRLGAYHEAAHRLILSGGEIEVVEGREQLPPGVREGVNLPLRRDGETLGVVGVTGSPSEIMDLAYAVKTSIESMAELELMKDRLLKRQAGRTLLVNRLIHRDSAWSLPASDLALKLGYDPLAYRTAVLVALAENQDGEELWRELKVRGLRRPQDFGASTSEGDLLIFRSLDLPPTGVLSAYEKSMEEFGRNLRRIDGRIRAFAGMFQRDLGLYHQAYRQALWLRSRYASAPEGSMELISRRLDQYLQALLPRKELRALFGGIEAALPELAEAGMREALLALGKRDFKLMEAARDLGLHRNTMTARLEGLERLFGSDPRTDDGARVFCRLLGTFLDSPGNPEFVHDAQSDDQF